MFRSWRMVCTASDIKRLVWQLTYRLTSVDCGTFLRHEWGWQWCEIRMRDDPVVTLRGFENRNADSRQENIITDALIHAYTARTQLYGDQARLGVCERFLNIAENAVSLIEARKTWDGFSLCSCIYDTWQSLRRLQPWPKEAKTVAAGIILDRRWTETWAIADALEEAEGESPFSNHCRRGQCGPGCWIVEGIYKNGVDDRNLPLPPSEREAFDLTD